MSAIGSIGDTVTIEEHDGKMGMWGDFVPAKSKPEVGPYLEEFGHKLGLSVFSESDGYEDPSTGRWVCESLIPSDPYKSVDLVVAAGRGGKFERVAESLGLLPKTSANAEEKEVSHMEIEKEVGALKTGVATLTTVVEGLVEKLDGKAKADLQIEANDAAVATIVESRFEAYDKAVAQIAEAKLTESQSASLRALAKAGEDVTPHIESAKKVIEEALALADIDEDSHQRVVESHLGGGNQSQKAASFGVAGFGKVG